MTQTSVAVHGAAGRMGRRLVALASEDREVRLVAAIESSASPLLGQDAGSLAGVEPDGVVLSDQLPGGDAAAVLIDFTVPAATRSALRLCEQRGWPMVIGTTGLAAADHAAIDAAA